MLRGRERQSGWQGASLVAITYVYFLIFAQFAFLNRLASLGVAGAHLKAVMAAMAVGGILFSLLTPRLSLWPSPDLRLRAGLFASGAAAFLSLLPLDPRRQHCRLFSHRRRPRPAHRHAGHTSAPMDRQSQSAPAGRHRHRRRLSCLQPSRPSLPPPPQTQAFVAGALCLAGNLHHFRARARATREAAQFQSRTTLISSRAGVFCRAGLAGLRRLLHHSKQRRH